MAELCPPPGETGCVAPTGYSPGLFSSHFPLAFRTCLPVSLPFLCPVFPNCRPVRFTRGSCQ